MTLAETVTEAYKDNNIDLIITSLEEIDNMYYQNGTYKIINNNLKEIFKVKVHARYHDPGNGGQQGNGRYVNPKGSTENITIDQKLIEYHKETYILLPLQEEYCFYHEPSPGTLKGVTLDGRSYKATVCDGCSKEINKKYNWAELNGIKRSYA